MSVLCVPPLEPPGKEWHSLGGEVVEFLTGLRGDGKKSGRFRGSIFGPGSLKGEPYRLDAEKIAATYRAYEIYPPGHPFEGRRRFKRVGLSWRKGTAKCLDWSVMLTMADGSRRRADQIHPADVVLSWDGARLVPAVVSAVWEQFPAPRYRITTEHGRSLTVTSEHPFAVKGTRWAEGVPKRRRYLSCDPDAAQVQWVKAEELRFGDRLMVATDWAGIGDGRLSPADAWVLGAIVGDGTGDGRFTNIDLEVLDRLRERYELTPLAGDSDSYYLRGGVIPFLRENGLHRCNAHTKRVPEAVFTGGRDVIAAFLAGYLDTDGHVSIRSGGAKKFLTVVEWGSVNHDLLADCQHLLTGLGVNASLKPSRSVYKGQPYLSWKLSVTDRGQAALLADLLPLAHVGKAGRLREIADRVGRCVFAGHDLDRVASVERLPDGPSVAIEVAETHTHVTDGLITHNTEWAAEICYAELHPEGPVRFDHWEGWDDDSVFPVGRPVRDPYIPMVAYSLEQAEELAFGALITIVSEGPDADLFDVGLERIIRLDGGRPDGKAVALSGSPNASDGARTTFQHFDETHRQELPRLVAAHETMLGNIPKRTLEDPWTLETTTAGRPGGGSIAESTHKEAQLIAEGKIDEPELFYFHREAGPQHDLKTLEGRIAAVSEATGPSGEYGPGQFRDIAKQWDRPKADRSYLERVWLNRWTRSDLQAYDPDKFAALGTAERIPPGAFVTAGFDGARFRDSTGFVLTDIVTGVQMPWALWERPEDVEDWEVPIDEVNQACEDIFDKFDVWQLYADPPYYVETVAQWQSKHPDHVTEFWTNQRRRMGKAAKAFGEAITTGVVTHTGDEDYVRHVGNAGKVDTTLWDEENEGQKLWILGKIRPEAKFDACMAGVLSWQARLDALAKNAQPSPDSFVPYRLR